MELPDLSGGGGQAVEGVSMVGRQPNVKIALDEIHNLFFPFFSNCHDFLSEADVNSWGSGSIPLSLGGLDDSLCKQHLPLYLSILKAAWICFK